MHGPKVAIGGATPGPAGARSPAGHAVPRLEKYWYFNIMSRLPECAPFRDRRAPTVPRLVPEAGAATDLGCKCCRPLLFIPNKGTVHGF